MFPCVEILTRNVRPDSAPHLDPRCGSLKLRVFRPGEAAAKVYFGRFDGGDRALFVIITYELLLKIVPHRAVLLGMQDLQKPATTPGAA